MSKTRLVDYLWDERYPCSLGDKQGLQRPGLGMRGIKAFETCLGVTPRLEPVWAGAWRHRPPSTDQSNVTRNS